MGRFTRGAAVLAAACMLFSGVGAAQAVDAVDSSGSGGSSTTQCVPDKSTIAQCFPDKALAAAVAVQLKGDSDKTGEVLTSGDVEETHSLFICDSEVSSLQGLQVFANLTELYLYYTKVSDVSPLANLTNLTWLGLSYTKVSDVSPLASLTSLTYLNLYNLDSEVGVTVNADGSASMPAPRWMDGTAVAPSSTSPAGGVLDAAKGVVTWAKYDPSASYSYDFSQEQHYGQDHETVFGGHVSEPHYTVSFDSQGGSAVASQSVAAGREASQPAAPTRTGYTFAGWNTAANGGSKYDFSKPIKADVRLYAHWTANVNAVSFDSQGGSTVTTQKVKSGEKVAKLADPTRAGYSFAGWYTAANGGSKYDFSKPIKADVRLYAHWTKNAQPSKPSNPSSATQDMYRLYNPNSGEHFYTAAKAERDHLKSLGWHDEGTGWTAPVKSDTPVYRLYNPNAGDHHYTVSVAERDMLVAAGWNFEGVGWYSADASDKQRAPLYRQYNPNAKAGTHNYTLSLAENDWLVGLGWHGEGIAWYAAHA